MYFSLHGVVILKYGSFVSLNRHCRYPDRGNRWSKEDAKRRCKAKLLAECFYEFAELFSPTKQELSYCLVLHMGLTALQVDYLVKSSRNELPKDVQKLVAISAEVNVPCNPQIYKDFVVMAANGDRPIGYKLLPTEESDWDLEWNKVTQTLYAEIQKIGSSRAVDRDAARWITRTKSLLIANSLQSEREFQKDKEEQAQAEADEWSDTPQRPSRGSSTSRSTEYQRGATRDQSHKLDTRRGTRGRSTTRQRKPEVVFIPAGAEHTMSKRGIQPARRSSNSPENRQSNRERGRSVTRTSTDTSSRSKSKSKNKKKGGRGTSKSNQPRSTLAAEKNKNGKRVSPDTRATAPVNPADPTTAEGAPSKPKKKKRYTPLREATADELAVSTLSRPIGTEPWRVAPPDSTPDIMTMEEALERKTVPWIVEYNHVVYDLRLLAGIYWCPLEFLKAGEGHLNRCERKVMLLRAFAHVKVLMEHASAFIEVPIYGVIQEVAYRLAHELGKKEESWESRQARLAREQGADNIYRLLFALPATATAGSGRAIAAPATASAAEATASTTSATAPPVEEPEVRDEPSSDREVVYDQGSAEPFSSFTGQGAKPKGKHLRVSIDASKVQDSEPPPDPNRLVYRWPPANESWTPEHCRVYAHTVMERASSPPAWSHELLLAAELSFQGSVDLARRVKKSFEIPKKLGARAGAEGGLSFETIDFPAALMVPLFTTTERAYETRSIQLPVGLRHHPIFEARYTGLAISLQWWALQCAKRTAVAAIKPKDKEDAKKFARGLTPSGGVKALKEALILQSFDVESWEPEGWTEHVLRVARDFKDLHHFILRHPRFSKPLEEKKKKPQPEVTATAPATQGATAVEGTLELQPTEGKTAELQSGPDTSELGSIPAILPLEGALSTSESKEDPLSSLVQTMEHVGMGESTSTDTSSAGDMPPLEYVDPEAQATAEAPMEVETTVGEDQSTESLLEEMSDCLQE